MTFTVCVCQMEPVLMLLFFTVSLLLFYWLISIVVCLFLGLDGIILTLLCPQLLFFSPSIILYVRFVQASSACVWTCIENDTLGHSRVKMWDLIPVCVVCVSSSFCSWNTDTWDIDMEWSVGAQFVRLGTFKLILEWNSYVIQMLGVRFDWWLNTSPRGKRCKMLSQNRLVWAGISGK